MRSVSKRRSTNALHPIRRSETGPTSPCHRLHCSTSIKILSLVLHFRIRTPREMAPRIASPAVPTRSETMDSILTGLGFSTEKQKSFKNKLYSWRTRTAKRTEILQNSDATEADHRWLSKDFLHSYGTTFWSTKYTEAGIISDEDEEA